MALGTLNVYSDRVNRELFLSGNDQIIMILLNYYSNYILFSLKGVEVSSETIHLRRKQNNVLNIFLHNIYLELPMTGWRLLWKILI